MRRTSRAGVLSALLATVLAGVGLYATGLAACLTGADAEGPFFVPNAPARSRLAGPGTPGVPLHLSGRVLAGDCVTPVSGALLEVWQADAHGCYSAPGGRPCPGAPAGDPLSFRAKVRADSAGRYAFSTVKPGAYGEQAHPRPSHIHVKILLNGRELLTTQIYFTGEKENVTDPLAAAPGAAARTIGLRQEPEGLRGVFDFTVDLDPGTLKTKR